MLAKSYRMLERYVPGPVKRLVPEAWRIRLGARIKDPKGYAAPSPPSSKPTPIPTIYPPLSLPPGESEESMKRFLERYYVREEGMTPERRAYLAEAFRRFLYTLQLVPQPAGKMLELGAAPYYMSLLLRRFREGELHVANYFNDAIGAGGRQVLVSDEGEEEIFDYANTNVERDTMPYEAGAFDTVLFCEVFEHLTNDPLRALIEIKRVLKQDGALILTTPNVARLANVVHVLQGLSIYDVYSAYGPYGRHNREYTVSEVRRLLEQAGFEIEACFTADTHPPIGDLTLDSSLLARFYQERPDELGSYIFIRARNRAPANPLRPAWLYRSYPDDQLAVR